MTELTALQAFQLLTALCETEGISLTLGYTNGLYVPGEIWIDNMEAEPKSEYLRQGPKGWTITVGGYMMEDPDTGEDMLYSQLGQALVDGLSIAKQIYYKEIP